MITTGMNESFANNKQQQTTSLRGGLGTFSDLANAVSGGLSEEKLAAAPTVRASVSQQQKLQMDNHSAHQRRQERKAFAAEKQASMQRQMKILMDDPELWGLFKGHLAKCKHTGSAGVQLALQQFLSENQELLAKYEEVQKGGQRQEASKKTVRMSLLQTVTSFTSDLAGERTTPSPSAALLASNGNNSNNQRRSASMGFGSAYTESHNNHVPQPRSSSMGMGVTNLAQAATQSTLDSATHMLRAAASTLGGGGGSNRPSPISKREVSLGSVAEEEGDDEHCALPESSLSRTSSHSTGRRRFHNLTSMESLREELDHEREEEEEEDDDPNHASGEIEVSWPDH